MRYHTSGPSPGLMSFKSFILTEKRTAMTHHIALYGTEGVGKSTLVANISAALVETGFSVLLREPAGSAARSAAEASGVSAEPDPAQVVEQTNPDYVLYDISGDCPYATLHEVIRQVDVTRLFVATSADFKALQAANDAFGFLEQYNDESSAPVLMGGLILNNITSSFEEAFVNDFAYHTNTRIIGKVPRSLVVRQCELYGQTVIEARPQSNQSFYYRRLANKIVDASWSDNCDNHPRPMSPERLRAWSLEWADLIYALENGLVTDGAAI